MKLRPKPNYWNLITSMVITTCIVGIVTGINVELPMYSWVSIGVIVGLLNPTGKYNG